jgi:hypothetical protein
MPMTISSALPMLGEKLLAELRWSRRDQPHDGQFHRVAHGASIVGLANAPVAIC